MSDSHEHRAATPLACNELKASLSAYLDDELTRDERLRADAHIVGCGPCRRLVERAEALDASLREKFTLDLEDAAREVDGDSVDVGAMQAKVLAAIGSSAPVAATPARRGWLRPAAIAAVLAGAALLAVSFSGNDAEQARSSRQPTQLISLDADDRQLLYSTGVILSHLRREGFERSDERTQLREVARYDELVERLNALITKLPAEDRAAVALARETIEFLLDASDDPARWEEIRRDMEATELDRRVDGLSDA
jgi:hypothetical protein